jgi:hypothetical protein
MFAKTMFMNVECPIGKWKKEEEYNGEPRIDRESEGSIS